MFQLTVDCMSSSLIISVPQLLAFSSVKLEDFMDQGNKYMWHIFCAFSSIAVVTCSKCNMYAVFVVSSCHPFHILKVYEKHSCPTWSCCSFPLVHRTASVTVPTNQNLTLDQKTCHICRKEVLLHSAVSVGA